MNTARNNLELMMNKRLWWKDDIPATCPRCGDTHEYTVYLNIESIVCNTCGLEFDVALFVSDAELKSI